MKQFLYMDTDIVNSIIAQAEKGLIINKQQENVNTSNQNLSASSDIGVDGKAGMSIFKLLSTEANVKSNVGFEGEWSHSTTLRNINEMKIHDEAFDIACQYIHINEKENISDDYGEYIKLNKVFNFVDLDYLEKLFSKDGIIDFIIESEQNKAEKTVTAVLNREQLRNSNQLIIKARKKVNEEYKSLEKLIKGFKNMVPYSKMLISEDGYLIPLDEQYFRVNSSSIGFMYDGPITCVGMITNIIGEDIKSPGGENIFGVMQNTINNSLKAILPTKERNICIVHPIAVFYEN